MRETLALRLKRLEEQVQALRDVLASDDPEYAEGLLCDGNRLSVTQVVLQPRTGAAEIQAFVEQTFPIGPP